MYRRYGIILIASSFLASGCTQTVRHTNTLLFATNSQIALSVGTNATTQPEIAVGYKRQEVVIMPLVANYVPNSNRPKEYVPCGSPSGPPASNCFIVGKNGTSGAQDSYSVLASFGAKFGGKSSGTTPEASVGIAQYFATGVAAQLLAATGGASIVTTAAPEAVTPAKAAVVAAVMNPDEAQSAALGVANYEDAVKAGVEAGLKRGLIASTGAACFKDPAKATKLLEDKASDLETAGKDSADALSIYLQDAGSTVQKEFSNQILKHC
ncbi:MAG: hypothetical protein CFE32_12135 [Alphaproteobacteria bacterium PA3]|nr:MAG: hypothetical protein CFE32_12135 [Alphaproteobacteria bacterium PA3]